MYIQPSIVSPQIAQFLESPQWRHIVYHDILLHRAASRSLELTIEALGPTLFQQNLRIYQTLQRAVNDACGSQVKLPCDSNGVRRLPNETDCLYDDMGCGFQCIDAVVKRYSSENNDFLSAAAIG